ncbi:pyridoxamine 5'-phosphate oxidase, partial [Flavobacteriaceae bacterium]|nr:pyridoxamine 5'-phosphate oxidase [Flavobacteriaceae bacterium]
ENQYEENSPKRPDHWGGFIVQPTTIEFWQGRPNRLHDRMEFSLNEDNSWSVSRLAP